MRGDSSLPAVTQGPPCRPAPPPSCPPCGATRGLQQQDRVSAAPAGSGGGGELSAVQELMSLLQQGGRATPLPVQMQSSPVGNNLS